MRGEEQLRQSLSPSALIATPASWKRSHGCGSDTQPHETAGGVLDVPAGRFRINGHLTVPANVTLQGIFRVPPTSGPRAITNLSGSVLLAYEARGAAEGSPFIRLAGRNAAIAGLIIAYPELFRRW